MKKELFIHKCIEYEIQIGENKHDNFNIIDDASCTDIWFHVNGLPSCHVILKTDEKITSIPRQVIKRCAYLCKINSKAKTHNTCIINYTTINNVTKTEIIGQVEIKNYKTVTI
jgi:predicted ribosome quality control (RQC) complex YloA/Tae2 family protein